MILSIRICLDADSGYVNELVENQKFCSQLYSYYCSLDGQERKRNSISEDMEMLFFLNKFDLMRLTISESFKVSELENGLDICRGILENRSISHENRQAYQ